MLPVTRSAGPTARKMECLNNLRNVGLEVHNFEASSGALPPAFTVDPDGQLLHSWRSAILPALDAKDVYLKIDRSKAWDNPANAEAYNTSLSIFRCSASTLPKSHTTYLAVVGINAAFHPTRPRALSEITDGHEQTLMLIEAPQDQAVHWMAPVDADEQLVTGIGASRKTAHAHGVHVVMINGSGRFLSVNVDPRILRTLVTINANDSMNSSP
ncbi:MAG: DUF1559 domain-containing protein [Planctomycetes bacterium]|nr:DUF1559 domain-containing protein [Planctomycetota bacterium]